LDEELQEQDWHLTHEPGEGACQAELVSRCLQGDEQAFARIVDLYGDLLLRSAYLLVQDEEAAKDIVQESLLLAWKNMHQLREPSSLRAWLVKIVVNQSTSLKRQWARRSAFLRQQLLRRHVEQAIQVADLQRGKVEETLDAWQAIEQLPLNQRVVLVLFYYHRMTMPEIAALLQTSENTLRKRLLSALNKVRRTLQIEVAEPPAARVGYSGGGME
jgi:RNA polymerase sigma-70 factor (ECF subfamily)